MSYLRGGMSMKIPTEHFHVEVALRGAVEANARVYNSRAKVDKTTEPDGQRLVIDEHDIPASTSESFAPPAAVTDPWWTVAIATVFTGRGIFWFFDTWAHVVSPISVALFKNRAKDYGGAALKPNLDGCGSDRRCAAARALALVDDKTSLSGFNDNLLAVRPLKEVLSSGTANNMEKAMLLRGALEAAGVDASLGALARNLENDFDPQFPSPGHLDHLVVFIERQPGFDASIFVDPSCEACALGAVPDWSRDRQVITFGKPSADTRYHPGGTGIGMTRVDGSEPAMSVHKQLIDATLDPEGAIRGHISDEWHGAQAVDVEIRSRKMSAGEWERRLADDLHERLKTAQPGTVTPLSWDKRQARATIGVEYTVPGFAASDGGRLVVPLTFMHMAVDRELSDEPRRHDVMVRMPQREEETIRVRLPAGWVASDLPTPGVWHSEAADGLVEVTSAPGRVTIKRVLQLHVGHWGPGEFDDLAGVIRKVAAVRAAAFTVAHAR